MASTTVAKMVYRLRHLIGSPSPTEGAPGLPAMLDALDRAMFVVSSKLPGRATLDTAFLSLVADTFTYSAGETDLTTLGPFRRASDGGEVFLQSAGAIMRYRDSNPANRGDPYFIGFEESGAGAATAYVYPTPVRADTLHAMRTVALTSVFQGLASTDLTLTSLSFGPYGTLAMEYMAAAELAPENPKAGGWQAMAADLIRREQYRINRQQMGGGAAVRLTG